MKRSRLIWVLLGLASLIIVISAAVALAMSEEDCEFPKDEFSTQPASHCIVQVGEDVTIAGFSFQPSLPMWWGSINVRNETGMSGEILVKSGCPGIKFVEDPTDPISMLEGTASVGPYGDVWIPIIVTADVARNASCEFFDGTQTYALNFYGSFIGGSDVESIMYLDSWLTPDQSVTTTTTSQPPIEGCPPYPGIEGAYTVESVTDNDGINKPCLSVSEIEYGDGFGWQHIRMYVPSDNSSTEVMCVEVAPHEEGGEPGTFNTGTSYVCDTVATNTWIDAFGAGAVYPLDQLDNFCGAEYPGTSNYAGQIRGFKFDGSGEKAKIVTDTGQEPSPERFCGAAGSTFIDVYPDNVFQDDIEWLAAAGITRGCNPPVNDMFCPKGFVTRGQMAAFLNRALLLPATNIDWFVDDEDSVFETDINELAEAGITRGCNPPINDEYCPHRYVTRGQMAAFLVRALDLPPNNTDLFVDDEESVFEADIQALAEADITRGCNPPLNNEFCPEQFVTREQMAAFLHRAEDYMVAVRGEPFVLQEKEE